MENSERDGNTRPPYLPLPFLLVPRLGKPFILTLDGSSSPSLPSVRCQKLSFWTSEKRDACILLCERNQMQKSFILGSRLLPLFIRQIGLKYLLPNVLPFPFYLLREETQKPGGRRWFCLGQRKKPIIAFTCVTLLTQSPFGTKLHS